MEGTGEGGVNLFCVSFMGWGGKDGREVGDVGRDV